MVRQASKAAVPSGIRSCSALSVYKFEFKVCQRWQCRPSRQVCYACASEPRSRTMCIC